MYKKINEKFRSNSRELNNKYAFVFVPIILFIGGISFCIVFPLFVKNNALSNWVTAGVMAFVVLFSLLNNYLLLYFSIRKEPQFSKKDFWRILYMVDLYQNVTHNKDIQLLIRLLKDAEVNTRPKVLEVLRHYQSLLPRKVIGASQIIAILALSITTLAFAFSDSFLLSSQNQLITILCIFGVVIVYFFGYSLNKYVFQYFGESALYIRIESALSEIWIKSLIK